MLYKFKKLLLEKQREETFGDFLLELKRDIMGTEE